MNTNINPQDNPSPDDLAFHALDLAERAVEWAEYYLKTARDRSMEQTVHAFPAADALGYLLQAEAALEYVYDLEEGGTP